jgi:Acetyltransferases, including N-acetylases of ribosomal proteins
MSADSEPVSDGRPQRLRPPELIDLDRIQLYRIRSADGPAMAAATRANVEHLAPRIRWGTIEGTTLEAQQLRCDQAERGWLDGSLYAWALREHPGGPIIGGCGLHNRVGPGALEIGYWLDEAHTGRGLITAAVERLTAIGLGLPGVNRIELHIDQANQPSSAVARRLGYRLEEVRDAEPWGAADSGRLQIWVRP